MRNNSGSRNIDNYTRYLKPAKGHWKYVLVNLLLRITVKWRHGLEANVVAVRKQISKLNDKATPANPNIERREIKCNGVSAQWLIPKHHSNERVLLYIHGGAFVAYSRDIYANMAGSWCNSLNARALVVDYRLSPEHAYPSASDDCITAYKWLLEEGFDPKDIVIAGDSAGGNLVLNTLLRIKDENLELPVCAVLISPFLDLTLSGRSVLANAKRDPIFTPAFAIDIRRHYVSEELYCSPLVSPLFGDFAGLPPMLFQVSSSEMLLDDSTRAATKASQAGVPVQLDIWESLPHVFHTIDALPQAKVAADRICHFIREHASWTTWPNASN